MSSIEFTLSRYYEFDIYMENRYRKYKDFKSIDILSKEDNTLLVKVVLDKNYRCTDILFNKHLDPTDEDLIKSFYLSHEIRIIIKLYEATTTISSNFVCDITDMLIDCIENNISDDLPYYIRNSMTNCYLALDGDKHYLIKISRNVAGEIFVDWNGVIKRISLHDSLLFKGIDKEAIYGFVGTMLIPVKRGYIK